MSGIRIQHPTSHDVTMTLVDAARPYQRPYECPACHRTHLFKTYHFVLDSVGAAIVSHEIADRLRRLPMQGGFAITGEVLDPPAQTLRPGGQWEHPAPVAHPTLVEPH